VIGTQAPLLAACFIAALLLAVRTGGAANLFPWLSPRGPLLGETILSIGLQWLLLGGAVSFAMLRPNSTILRMLVWSTACFIACLSVAPTAIATPWPIANDLLAALHEILGSIVVALLVGLASFFATPLSELRRWCTNVAYLSDGLRSAIAVGVFIAKTTRWLDLSAPIFSKAASVSLEIVMYVSAATCSLLALAATNGSQRARAFLVLLPLAVFELAAALSHAVEFAGLDPAASPAAEVARALAAGFVAACAAWALLPQRKEKAG
jgi:hypothetical protein